MAVDSIDATLILQFVAGLLDQLRCEFAADVNGDGSTSSIDAQLILQQQAGLIFVLSGDQVRPSMIWAEATSNRKALEACWFEDRRSCAREVMLTQGATGPAIDFFRRFGTFLVRFEDIGAVDLAYLYDPWRARPLGERALVNGDPVLLHAEGFSVPLDYDDPAIALLAVEYSNLWLWADQVFPLSLVDPSGAQTFVLLYFINDGCLLCGTGYSLAFAVDFSETGTYQPPPRPLEVCKSYINPPKLQVPPDVDDCGDVLASFSRDST